jgi:hypothetical protein
MNDAKHDIYEGIFLTHVSVLGEPIQERYFDIIESLKFAVSINSANKTNFEFQNLCDFLDETNYEDIETVFEYWGEFL